MIDTVYRFEEFELNPRERTFKQGDKLIPLRPKAFDMLLFLVRRAECLVTKQELMDHLWPSMHVSEANRTNTIASLRKVVFQNTATGSRCL